MLGVEGRQRADHHDVRPDRPGALLGLVEAGPQLRLELGGGRAGQRGRPHVHLDVELAHLGLEDLVGDRGEDLLVAHRRVLLGVDQVELDLRAGQRPLEVELRLVRASGRTRPGSGAASRGSAGGPRARTFGPRPLRPRRSPPVGAALCGQVGTEPAWSARRAVGAAASAATVRRGRSDVKVTDSWYSERMEQPIGLARWGHYGTPVLVFPTAGGDAEEIERNGLVGACWPLIESRPGQALLLRQRGRAGDGRQGRVAGVPDVAVQPVPPRRPARGRAGDPGRPGRRTRRRSSPPAPRSGRSTPSRCSAASRTCSAPRSA